MQNKLDGKKVIFIGNSYVYYGQTVLSKPKTALTQAERSHDHGYFYQLCRACGAAVEVTNWTFGGHGLTDLFGEPCQHPGSCAGHRHEFDLLDRAFDYVFVSPGGGERSAVNIADDFAYLTRFFRAANPDVQIVCLGNLGAHGYSSVRLVLPAIYTYYSTLEDMGVIVANWGGIVKGLIDGEFAVPGGTQTYTASSFVVKDGFHPNPLAGYITCATAYCSVTGESAAALPYTLWGNGGLEARFDFDRYCGKYYERPEDTNFRAVFASPADMRGIGQLIDWYLAEKPYRK